MCLGSTPHFPLVVLVAANMLTIPFVHVGLLYKCMLYNCIVVSVIYTVCYLSFTVSSYRNACLDHGACTYRDLNE